MIEVSAGIIIRGTQVLVCKRPAHKYASGLWEFPGGKQNPGETAADCLIRECREELAITLAAPTPFDTLDWTLPDGSRIRFTFFFASIAHGEPICLEHDEIQWRAPQALSDLTFCPPDAHILPRIIAALSGPAASPSRHAGK